MGEIITIDRPIGPGLDVNLVCLAKSIPEIMYASFNYRRLISNLLDGWPASFVLHKTRDFVGHFVKKSGHHPYQVLRFVHVYVVAGLVD